MDLHRATSPGRVGDGAPAVQEPAETPRRASEGYTASSRMRSAAVAFAMLSATYYLNILILIDVAFAMLYEQSYGRWELIRMWDALLVGQFIGQIVSGISCDTFGEEVSLCASLVVLFVGAVLCAVARGVQESTSSLLWFVTIARGIIGVGIGGVYPPASIIAFEVVDSMVTHKERAFVLLTNGVFNAGGLLATIIFLIVLSAAQPGHLATVWPVCIGIGIVVPFAAISYSILRVMARRYRGRAMRYMSMYSSEFKRHWITMARTCLLWFVYDFAVYPKIIFSGVILYTIVDGDIWRTAGFELLLAAFALGGSLAGAMVCDTFGKRNTILVSFVGYVVFALIIGCAYDRLIKVVPLLVIFYALMIFMGNLGPGNLLSLIATESYPQNVRGSFYGVTAAFGTAGAVAGMHAFNTIDENLRKQWGFIIAAVCGAVGIVVAYFLPSHGPLVAVSASQAEKCAVPEDVINNATTSAASNAQQNGCPNVYPRQGSMTSVDKDDTLDTNDHFVPVANGANGLRVPGASGPRQMPGAFSPHPSGDRTCGRHAGQSSSNRAHTRASAPVLLHLANIPSDATQDSFTTRRRVNFSGASCADDTGTPELPQQHLATPSVVSYARTSVSESASALNAAPHDSSCVMPEPQADASSFARPQSGPSHRVMLLQRMSGYEPLQFSAPALDIQEAHEVITEHVAASGLQKFFKEDDAFVKTVEANAAHLQDDRHSFPITRENVQRLIRLSLYHPVIYCDDSSSMSSDVPSRWALQRKAVARIASITTRALPHPYGVSLRFINAVRAAQDNIPATAVLNAVDRAYPDGGTPLGTNLRNHVLQPLVYDVLDRPDHHARLLDRPLLICVITDGCPTDSEGQFESTIAECRQRLVRAGYEPTAVRFCVNQIGHDASSTMFLERLRSNPNIQDIVYCTTERLDEKFREFRDNGRQLDQWLLRMLSDPIVRTSLTARN